MRSHLTLVRIEIVKNSLQTDPWLLAGKGMEEGRIGSLGLADVNIAWINSKVQLYSTGNYIQYPVIKQNRKEYKNECIYV